MKLLSTRVRSATEGQHGQAPGFPASAANRGRLVSHWRGPRSAVAVLALAVVGLGATLGTGAGPALATSATYFASGFGTIGLLSEASNGATAISGVAQGGIGVHGSSTSPNPADAGVDARGFQSATGVTASSDSGNGIIARSGAYDAIHAIGGGGTSSGLWAEGGSGYGAAASSTGGDQRAAVIGIGYNNTAGLKATSQMGYGVSAQGGQAPLYLAPGANAGPPTSGTHLRGELIVDSTGALYFCTANGTPGTWKQVVLQ